MLAAAAAAAAAATLLLGLAGCGSVRAPGQEASSGPAASTRARSGSSPSIQAPARPTAGTPVSGAPLAGPVPAGFTQAGVAAVLDGRDVLVTRDGGFTFTLNPVPCTAESAAPSVAETSATGLAVLCTGGGYTGHTVKQVYLSDDDGARWVAAGTPSPAGDGGTIAATTTGDVAIATASAASWLFHSGNGGVTWRIVNEQYDGGVGWADLGFTTATGGVVVHGPANGDGNSTQRPGQLFLTSDGGTTWHLVSF